MTETLRPAIGNETYAGRLARTFPELGTRECNAITAENFAREVPASVQGRYAAENARRAITNVRNRIEDAGIPELCR